MQTELDESFWKHPGRQKMIHSGGSLEYKNDEEKIKKQWRSMAHENSEIKWNSDQELEWGSSMRVLAKNML